MRGRPSRLLGPRELLAPSALVRFLLRPVVLVRIFLSSFLLCAAFFLIITIMGRTVGATDRNPRARKCSTDREKENRRERRQKKKQRQNEDAANMAAYLSGGRTSEQEEATTEPEINDTEESEPVEERREVHIANVGTFRQADKIDDDGDDSDSESDENDDDDDDSDYEGNGDNDFYIDEDIADMEKADGPMQQYLKAVHDRLQEETKVNPKQALNYWLVSLLKENDWSIPAIMAKKVCRKLRIEFSEEAYYCEIKVWLPDVMFEEKPQCPNKCGNRSCNFHCWRENHYGRLVTDFYRHYFIISRRYICKDCQAEAKKAKEANQVQERAREAARKNGGSIETIQPMHVPNYTFMGWDKGSVEQLPDGLGENFPAFLTYKAAVDITLLDFMRPLLSAGFRVDQMRDLLLELATKRHARQWKKREHKLARKRQKSGNHQDGAVMFGEFGDKSTYCGYVPSAKYLGSVYKKYTRSLKGHYETEVKKRGARFLRWDVSYKEAKKLCRFKGKSVFKGLVTATNELGEIRMQFHIVTDGHDQMLNALKDFRDAVAQHGLDLPELLFTDKPKEDYDFFSKQLPSLVETEQKFGQAMRTVNFPTGIPSCDIELEDIQYAETVEQIDTVIYTLIDHLKAKPANKRVLGLDEEHECGSKIKFPPKGRDRIALIQLAYEHQPGNIRAILLKCHQLTELPSSLRELFSIPDLLYVGSRVKGDIDRIGEDFKCREIARKMRFQELALMAKDRGVVDDGRTGLKKLVLLVLEEDMSKDDTVRSSKWSSAKLTDSQKKYAALDATKSLEIYFQLASMVCFADRLTQAEAKQGIRVDIIAPHGKVGASGMGVVAGIGTIIEGAAWDPPQELQIRRVNKQKIPVPSRVVKVDRVFAPSLVLPGYKKTVKQPALNSGSANSGTSTKKKKERAAVLGDFSTTPFTLELPLTMLKRHDPRIDASVSSTSASARQPGEQRATRSDQESPMWQRLVEGIDDDCQLQESERLAAELTVEEMAEIQLCFAAADQMRDETQTTGLLDPAPASIVDVFRSILGDPWHFMDRPKVPVKHEFKKAYFVAFMEAWFVWDPKHLDKVKKALRRHGMSAEQIDAKMYHNIDFFLECCPRVVPPPSILYWRVRSVFATYGNKKDSVSGAPLFNNRAWKKANNLLKEILLGYASDPPGVSMYMFKIDKDGEIQQNKYGLPLYYCLRGTGLTEVGHKQLLQSVGTCATGIEMSDAIRSEHRHRYNHRMGERRRAGFPLLGHYDTWLVDGIQILVEKNHNVLVYPTWSNGRDWHETPETFGTVPLQTSDLTDAVNELTITPKLTQEQQYLSDQQGVKVCFTPVAFPSEYKLFGDLALTKPGLLNDLEAMALEWVSHVDGKTIFPKLPVYLRAYREKYLQNRRIETAVSGIENEIKRLKQLNERTLPAMLADRDGDGDGNGDNNNDQQSITCADDDEPGPEPGPQPVSTVNNWPQPEQPPQLPPPPRHHVALAPRTAAVVGGTQVGLVVPPAPTQKTQRKRGDRGCDKQKRGKRRCMRCVCNGVEDEAARGCPGAYGRKGHDGCMRFDESGRKKNQN